MCRRVLCAPTPSDHPCPPQVADAGAIPTTAVPPCGNVEWIFPNRATAVLKHSHLNQGPAESMALFTSDFFKKMNMVALLIVFNKYCSIID